MALIMCMLLFKKTMQLQRARIRFFTCKYQIKHLVLRLNLIKWCQASKL